MKIAYLDCASGISGDMTLGALVDAGVDLAALNAAIGSLGLPGCRLVAEEVKKRGFRATQVTVQSEPEHGHRHLHHILAMIDRSGLSDRQKDLARDLHVHESTICRALANKYCRLPSDEVVSFELFFDSALPIREMISRLVAVSSEPLSDGEIAKRLAQQGVTVARRTVAKYRDQLKLPPYQLRAA